MELIDVKNRMTVVESVYHQMPAEEATPSECRFSRELESDEQPYQRNLKVEEEWVDLNFVWIEKVGMLCIYNEEGKGRQTIPSEEEVKALSEKVLEVSFQGRAGANECWLVLPGESMRGVPNGHSLMVRSRSGLLRYSVFVIPG